MIELHKPRKTLDIYDGQAIKFKNTNNKETAVMICRDEDPLDPRVDNDGIITRMICWHRRYNLGDKHTFTDTSDMLTSLLKELDINVSNETEQDAPKMMSLLHNLAVVLPLWLYDHSGLTISCGERSYPYNDTWDSGQIGWIILLKTDMINAGLEVGDDWRKKALDICRDDVRIYDMWLTGEVYGYKLFEKENNTWNETDSCWGFYGTNILDNGMTEYIEGLSTAIETEEYEITNPTKHISVAYDFD